MVKALESLSFCVLVIASLGCEPAEKPGERGPPPKPSSEAAAPEPGPAPAPAPAPAGPEIGPAPAPMGAVEEEEKLPTTTAPCVAMTGTALDFTIPATLDNVWSVEANAMVGGSDTATTVTLVTALGTTAGTLTLGIGFDGSTGQVRVTDGNGSVQMVVPPSGDEKASLVTIDYVADATFVIEAFPSGSLLPAKPRPNFPPPSNKAVVKTVPTCPRG